jgi:uncharacterized protein YdiU (UPF0061 family)
LERALKDNQIYAKFNLINGSHPFQEAMKNFNAYVSYEVRTISDCKILYFNFQLAKELGLINDGHPHKLNRELERIILDTFAITIINEYDILNKTPIDPSTKKENRYMATRYLQLQHPNKKGKTSGDGRSIWNGIIEHNGRTYDITSCGTGATCLSPASAIQGKFFKTGDPKVSYGCGMAEISDGYSASILSEIFHHNKIATERTLAIIDFDNGLGINVRVGENLIRPSHFFIHLKQGNLSACTQITDYCIQREISNGHIPISTKSANKENLYQLFLENIITTFAKMSALFESEYIFCWLDWDGDNILIDGGIIDYGSVRQFGLFHHKYRYDDIDRFSTTIVQQKTKAKYIVQTFIQLIDFVTSGQKKNIKHFAHHRLLKRFDQIYEEEKKRNLLTKIGMGNQEIALILNRHMKTIEQFQNTYSYFERQTSSKGEVKTADGINQNAIFCMRDLLRHCHTFLKPSESLSTKTYLNS